MTGLDPMLGDEVSLSLFPSGTVTLPQRAARRRPHRQPAVAADELTARLRYFPLLAGRIEIADVTLVRPIINVTFSAGGKSNWSGLIVSLAHALAAGSPPHRFVLGDRHSGRHCRRARRRQGRHRAAGERRISGRLAVDLAQFRRQRPFRLERAAGRGEPDAERLFRGAHRRPFRRQIAAVRRAAAISPSTARRAISRRSKSRARSASNAPSLRDALRWTGKSKAAVRRLRPICTARAKRHRRRRGGAFQRQCRARRQCRRRRADAVDRRSSPGARHARGRRAGSDALCIRRAALGQKPAQLGCAADRARRLRRFQSRSAAVRGQHQDRRTRSSAAPRSRRTCATASSISPSARRKLSAAPPRARSASPSPRTASRVTSHMQFLDVDLERCLGQMFGVRKLAGRGNLAINVDGSGESVLAVTRALNGTASLNAQSGAMAGINVEQLLRRLQRRPLSGSGDFRSGSTPFDRSRRQSQDRAGRGVGRGHACRRTGSAARGRRPGLGADARSRPQGRGDAGFERAMPTSSICLSSFRVRGTTRSCCRTRRA